MNEKNWLYRKIDDPFVLDGEKYHIIEVKGVLDSSFDWIIYDQPSKMKLVLTVLQPWFWKMVDIDVGDKIY